MAKQAGRQHSRTSRLRNLGGVLCALLLVACSPAKIEQPSQPVSPTIEPKSVLAPAVVTQELHSLVPAAKALIYDSEVSSTDSDHSYYDRHYEVPTWPLGQSGVTVAIGTDLGTQSREFTETCWLGFLGSDDTLRLESCAGVTGKAAKALCAQLQDIRIKWAIADAEWQTFELPSYWSLTARTFPGFDLLRENAQGAVVSLVYNRGSSLVGASRVDMRVLRDAIKTQAYEKMAEAEKNMLVTMGPAWKNAGIYDGMEARRQAEAELILTP